MGISFQKNSIIYGMGSILPKALGFILIPLYTRYFTVEEYGMLSLLGVILQLFTFIFLIGISSAAMRFYFSPGASNEYQNRLYGNAVILLILIPIFLYTLTTPLMHFISDIF